MRERKATVACLVSLSACYEDSTIRRHNGTLVVMPVRSGTSPCESSSTLGTSWSKTMCTRLSIDDCSRGFSSPHCQDFFCGANQGVPNTGDNLPSLSLFLNMNLASRCFPHMNRVMFEAVGRSRRKWKHSFSPQNAQPCALDRHLPDRV